jgi:DNA polymerase III epsilon subunit-like protein
MKTLTLDIETSGLPTKNADYKFNYMDFPRICGIAWKCDDAETVHYIINQEGFIIPQETINIHGITNEIANASQHFLADIIKILISNETPDLVIGHNIYFDTSIIKANVLRLIKEGKLEDSCFDGIEAFLHKDRRIDTMRKSIRFCGVGAFPKLSVLYSKLFNEEFDGHTAKTDVDATYRCYVKLQEMGLI